MIFVSDVDTDPTFYSYHCNFGSFYVVSNLHQVVRTLKSQGDQPLSFQRLATPSLRLFTESFFVSLFHLSLTILIR